MIYAISLPKIPADFKKLFFPAICTLIELLKKAAKVCGQLAHRSPTLSPCLPPSFLPPSWHIATSCEMAKIAKNNMTAGDASWHVKRERERDSELAEQERTLCTVDTLQSPSGHPPSPVWQTPSVLCRLYWHNMPILLGRWRRCGCGFAASGKKRSWSCASREWRERGGEGEGRKCVERGLSQSCHINWQNN